MQKTGEGFEQVQKLLTIREGLFSFLSGVLTNRHFFRNTECEVCGYILRRIIVKTGVTPATIQYQNLQNPSELTGDTFAIILLGTIHADSLI